MAGLDNNTIWLKNAFLLPTDNTLKDYGSGTRFRRATSAAFKFTNTTLGGNFAFNNPPQPCKFTDIRLPGRGRPDSARTFGMGRWYSEAIDDPRQLIHVVAGVHQFTSWTNFITNFYDAHAARLANSGSVNPLWYNMGNLGGYVVSLPFQPAIQALTIGSRILNFFTKSSPSKWFYFKPTMHNYWSAVNLIANEMAVDLGIIPRAYSKDNNLSETQDPGQRVTPEDLATYNRIYPNLFNSNGGIDVMLLASRTQRMADASQKAMRELSATANALNTLSTAINNTVNQLPQQSTINGANAYMKHYLSKVDQTGIKDFATDANFNEWSRLKGLKEYATSVLHDGNQFVTFRVNYTGSQTDSFSNSTQDVGMASTINTKVSSARQAHFNAAGGNIVEGMGTLLTGLKDMGAGALDAVNLGGLAVLAGSAFVDVPEMWADAVASLPEARYTIPLPNCYGNVISRYMNLYLPIAMVLPLALPLSAGRSAYTAPFLTQIYSQGQAAKQLCIVDSLSIVRNKGNVGMNAENDMLGAEIQIGFKDLSKIASIPIKGGFASASWIDTAVKAAAITGGEIVGDTAKKVATAATDGTVWDEQSVFQDYMAVMTGMNVSDLYYAGRRLSLNIAKSMANFDSWRSPANLAGMLGDTWMARVASAFSQSTDRL